MSILTYIQLKMSGFIDSFKRRMKHVEDLQNSDTEVITLEDDHEPQD